MSQLKLPEKAAITSRFTSDLHLLFRLFLFPLIAAVFLALSPVGQKSAEAIPLDGIWRYYDGVAPTSPEAIPGWLNQTIRGGFAGWNIYNGISHPNIDPSATDIWVTTYVPPHSFIQPTLYFITNNQAVEVFYDSHIIYKAGDIGEENYGTRWHLMDLPRDSSGRTLSFHLYSPINQRLGVINSPNIGNAIEQVLTIVWGDVMCLLALPLSLFIIVLVGIYYISHREKMYLYMLAFMLFYSLWLLATSNVRQVFLDAPVFWRNAQLLSIYMLCPLGNLMSRELVESRDRTPFSYLIYAYIGLALMSVLGEVMGFGTLESGVSLSYLLLGTAQLYIMYLIARSAFRGNKRSRALLPSVVAIPVLGFLDGLTIYYHLLPFSFYWFPLSIVFILYFVIRILQENFAAEQLLNDKNRELEQRVQIDDLTKCFNRSTLNGFLIRDAQTCRRSRVPFTVLMLDIDFFKKVNDEFGHPAGDKVLVSFAGTIRTLLDSRHTFIRYGGEEFVILCRDFSLPQAEELARTILLTVASTQLLPDTDKTITTSIGISLWHGESDTNLIKRADEALYAAKQGGRNCYRVEAE
ncbi:MAG: diguanylate cyclase [Selenomonadaceae bacterium]|nr:diguanylate cyclase [Selenomonadaceae bacterium]